MRDPDPRLAPSGLATYWRILLCIFAVDRATKWWAQDWLRARFSVPLAPFFHLTYVENTGAAFGLLRDSNAALTGVSLALLGALAYLRRRWPEEDRLSHVAIALVTGGAVGNLYDRMRYGYVVDFLDFRVWPVFNVADSCISIGATLLAWGMHRRKEG